MENSKIHEILDRVLSGYVDAEPLAGLDQRIIRRVQTFQPRRKPIYFGLAAVSLLSALLTVALIEIGKHPTTHQRAPNSIPIPDQVAQVAGQTQISPKSHTVTRPRLRTVARAKPLHRLVPKQEQFPSPSPITTEERALIAFVRQHPDDAISMFSDLHRQTDEPLTIKPIQIQPLESETVP